ncbi:Cse1-domain-containing protein [Choiromyces venosus 120613-1]|uniref:Cse1-domain-containing protein n=1 Tax=Choiromyces venosus 120613-1 TaxID=1336337 RepID=A0A3N4KBQ2_9PEZI|nr:Cse1-domain-containing protein [Choiromyces venosus 120613-1]
MAANIQTLAQLLDTSLIPSQNKQAESSLRANEGQEGFALLLLQIVASDSFASNTRLAAALYFKNLLGRNWTDEEGHYKMAETEVVAVKRDLVGLMITVPPVLQVQLGEAISTIAESDFWQRWDTLIDDLVSKLTPDNAQVNNGVLQVAHAIFKRWRPLFRSDDLFTEINHVLQKFTAPFLKLMEATDQQITQSQNNKPALDGYFQTLNLVVKISFDLNCQDLAPDFEENLTTIMGLLHKYLTFTNPLLVTDDDDESGPLERVKAGICEILQLFTTKYEDVFDEMLQNFVNSTWMLLTTTGPEPKYDILVSKALQFLTAVARSSKHAQNFSTVAVLEQVVEKIILPNMTLRTSDEELFEDDPIEFIRRDLEGSDSDTRRRASTDFLRQLLEQFDKTVTEVVYKYIDHYLQDYNSNPKENWRSKDTALYLFSSIAAKGTTERKGVTHTNLLVDVVEFFQNHIAADLIAPFEDVQPILKVDAIKYLYTFRSQLTKSQLSDAFPLLARHFGSPNYVVYTYTAITVERLLAMTSDGDPLFHPEDLRPYAKDLFENLFRLIEQGVTPEKIQENEYLMRCVMRVIIVAKDATGPLVEYVLGELIRITGVISKNPSNPRFIHYHFESLGGIIRFVAPGQPESLENALHDPFMAILGQDVTGMPYRSEFIPYVFQLLALLLESNVSAHLPQRYKDLITPLLTPALWESRGNVPALVRLLQAIMARGASHFVENNQISAILGIFQKLVASKLTEIYAFELLEACFIYFPLSVLKPFVKDIFVILLTRLNRSKTEALSQRFARFFYFLAARNKEGTGPDFVIEAIDAVQADIFRQLYGAIVLPDTQKLQRPTDRKVAVVGLTKFVAFSEGLATAYHETWPGSVVALLKLLEAPPVPTQDDGGIDLHEADIDDLSFGATFTRLNTCKKRIVDLFPDTGDLKKWVGERLKEGDSKYGGRVDNWIKAELPDEAKVVLRRYMQ